MHAWPAKPELLVSECKPEQVFLAVEWLVDNVNPKFVLKTDDDAYVDTAHMVTALRELCQQPSCEDERCVLLKSLSRTCCEACARSSKHAHGLWVHASYLRTWLCAHSMFPNQPIKHPTVCARRTQYGREYL